MGEEIIGKIRQEGNTTEGKTSGSTDSTRARTRTRTRARTRTEEEKERLLKLANVEEKKIEKIESKTAQNEPVKLEINSDGNLQEKTPTVKKTRKRRTKKTTLNSEPIEKTLMAVSGMIASRPNCECWAMTAKEAKSIAEPLTQVLDKYDIGKNIAENSAEIALITGITLYTIPRIAVTAKLKKGSRNYVVNDKGKREKSVNASKTLDKERKSEISVQRDNERSSALPATVSIFGSPL